MTKTDWGLLQAFLAVADHGSLSRAARATNASQPTLGRQVRALEQQLSAELFHRHRRGFALSETGHRILPHARAMQAAMQQITLTAAGRETRLAGDVRITSSVFMAHVALPGIIARMRQAEPDIRIDLIPSDASENLLFREADIAVRMYRPTQLDIVTRHVADIPVGVFAAKSYLERVGRPENLQDLRQFDMVGYDRNDLIIRAMRDRGIPADRDWFTVRCDSQSAYWELIRAGCGIGFTQKPAAQAMPDVQELFAGLELPSLPIWLATHEALRHTPRIRRVWDMLADGLTRFVS